MPMPPGYGAITEESPRVGPIFGLKAAILTNCPSPRPVEPSPGCSAPGPICRTQATDWARDQFTEPCRPLLKSQRGVVPPWQADQAGITPAEMRSLVRSGRWRRLHLGVYAAFT